jgi:hypothetical protein
MQTYRTFIVAGLVALCAARLDAVVTVYSASDVANSTDPRPNSDAMAASFDAAAGGMGPVSIIDFESAPVGVFNNLVVAPGVTMDGVDYTASDQQILNASIGFPADGYWGYNTTPAGVKFVQNAAGDLTFTFSTPIQSFGAYISGTQLDYNNMVFTNSNGVQTIPVPNPSSALGGITFVGFTDPGESISSVSLTSIGDILGVDDVRFGMIPEPGAAALGGMALAATLCRPRRRENP